VDFWDSSALIQLYVEQTSSKALRALYLKQSSVLVWWGTQTECVRNFCRLCRDGALGRDASAAERNRDLLLGLLSNDWKTWDEIEPTEHVRRHANEAARRYLLRSMDALQLGAALTAADGDPSSIGFVCCDERLSSAAAAEGFRTWQAR
jgi:predicted nucleic acid-binding protein